MNPFCPQAVIFDMDGLLVDSEPVWHFVESEMLQARGKSWEYTIQKDLIGLRMSDFWASMCSAYQLTETPDVLIAEATNRMVEAIPHKVVARPGADELLAYFQKRDVPMAIASSSPMAIIDAVVESRGWARYFQVWVSGDEVAHGKPAPDIYLETARRMNVAPRDVLTLEDSRNGARSAVAAGMICYAVPDPTHNSPTDFEGVTPHVFDSLHDVLKVLEPHCV
ncbi:MAG TPA: HAD family phosphatase [Oceanobacillus sp.]|jgi:HAD superfamily hydrolase (TIGR01509 family)|nr:HAD family phosphatase [Oceanobacillus sp.]